MLILHIIVVDMLPIEERRAIIALMRRQVVPAVGCTEPIAVALCVTRARELLGYEPESVRLRLSANILKNAMGVGIPGTGMVGLPIAIALGVLVGRSEYQLEVLKDSDRYAVERGKRYIEEGHIHMRRPSSRATTPRLPTCAATTTCCSTAVRSSAPLMKRTTLK